MSILLWQRCLWRQKTILLPYLTCSSARQSATRFTWRISQLSLHSTLLKSRYLWGERSSWNSLMIHAWSLYPSNIFMFYFQLELGLPEKALSSLRQIMINVFSNGESCRNVFSPNVTGWERKGMFAIRHVPSWSRKKLERTFGKVQFATFIPISNCNHYILVSIMNIFLFC